MKQEITALELSTLAASLPVQGHTARERVDLAFELFQAAKARLEMETRQESVFERARLHDAACEAYWKKYGPKIKLADIARHAGFTLKSGKPDYKKLERELDTPFEWEDGFVRGVVGFNKQHLRDRISYSTLQGLVKRFPLLREHAERLIKKDS